MGTAVWWTEVIIYYPLGAIFTTLLQTPFLGITDYDLKGEAIEIILFTVLIIKDEIDNHIGK